jgi:hypothetical protein
MHKVEEQVTRGQFLDVASIAGITLTLSWCVDGPAIATPVAGYAIKKRAASVARAVRRRTNVDVGFNGTSAVRLMLFVR